MRHAVLTVLMPNAVPLSSSEQTEIDRAMMSFVDQAMKRAPWFVRLAEIIMAPACWMLFWPLVQIGKRKNKTPAEACAPAVAFLSVWGGPLATLIRLYQYLAALAYFDHDIVHKHFKQETPGQRQSRYREIRSKMMAAS